MSSPWGKIEQVENVNFQDIMSEEYARALQNKENQKLGIHLSKQIHDLKTDEKIDSPNDKNYIDNSTVTTSSPCDHEIGDGDGVCGSIENYEIIGAEHAGSLSLHANVLKAISDEMPYNLDDFCESDRIIAEMLQSEFDRDHDVELKRLERQTNKDSKVSVSFSKYRNVPDELLYDSDLDDEPHDRKHWDNFDINKKLLDNLPKKGFGYDEDGVRITKHDATLCGVRNACRVMSFPPEFQTGDAVDIKLSNAVFNQLKTYSQRTKKTKAHDRKDNIATAEMGVDERTRIILYKLISNQIVEQVNGIISTGKEALILHAESDPAYVGDVNMPKHLAIKIFKTTLNEFKQRDRYIKDDYRFKDRFSKQNNRVVIHMWAEKEMHNLIRMRKCGINCPEVITLKKHVLVMSFIGNENLAAPKLKEAALSLEEYIFAYDEVVEMMCKLYNDAKLVHADLSEYNILWHADKCWLIDVAQSVEPEHPSALEFMMRDCRNISTVSGNS